MTVLPQISEAEFEVMKVVWKRAPVSTNEVTDLFNSPYHLEPQNNTDSAETPGE